MYSQLSAATKTRKSKKEKIKPIIVWQALKGTVLIG